MDLTHFSSKLEPFLLMAKSVKGAAAAKLAQDATAAPGVYVFSELLELPNIQELAKSEQHASSYALLQLYAYKTYQDYLQHKDSLPSLNAAQITKLKHLTIVSLASERRIIPYADLQRLLEVPTVRALEDLVIDAIYLDLLQGRLDQKEAQLEVSYTMGRDIEPGRLEEVLGALKDWASTTAAVLSTLDNKIASIAADASAAKIAQQEHERQLQATLKEVHERQKEKSLGGGMAQRRVGGVGGVGGASGASGAGGAGGASGTPASPTGERADRENMMDVDEPEGRGKNRKAPENTLKTRKRNKF